MAPSGAWWRDFLQAYISGLPESEAIIIANSKMDDPRSFGRFRLRNQKGEEILLSVAVAGGGRQLRDAGSLDSLILSEHGNWRHLHLGAIEAVLGASPFFRDLYPDLKEVYHDTGLTTLRNFNLAIFRVLFSFLMGNLSAKDLRVYADLPVVKSRGEELREKIDSSLSSVQILALYGKETIIGWLE